MLLLHMSTIGLVVAIGLSACGASSEESSTPPVSLSNCVSADFLVQRIDAFDHKAIRTAFESLHCYDGAEIEDVYRSLGVAFSTNQKLVTNLMLESGIGTDYATPMFTMLPLAYVDDACGSVSELKKRKALIEVSAIPEGMRQVFLSSVEHSIERDKSHCP